jgi:PAS domain S-box-containing protein
MIDRSRTEKDNESFSHSHLSSSSLISDRINELKEKTDFVVVLFEKLVGYAIIVADFDGNIIAYNEGAHQIYGHVPEDVIGKEKIEIFFQEDPSFGGKLQQIINDLIETGTESFEDEMVRKDGETFPAHVLLTLTRNKNGKVVGFILIAEDLTERRLAEERRRIEEQERAEELKRIRQLEEEINIIQKFSAFNPVSVAAKMYGQSSLQEALPDLFDQLVQSYCNLMELRLEALLYKGKEDISKGIPNFADQLGFLQAGPRDVVSIHSSALKIQTDRSNPKKSRAYLEEGRLMVLELMGHLVSYYRANSLGTENNRNRRTGEQTSS